MANFPLISSEQHRNIAHESFQQCMKDDACHQNGVIDRMRALAIVCGIGQRDKTNLKSDDLAVIMHHFDAFKNAEKKKPPLFSALSYKY